MQMFHDHHVLSSVKRMYLARFGKAENAVACRIDTWSSLANAAQHGNSEKRSPPYLQARVYLLRAAKKGVASGVLDTQARRTTSTSPAPDFEQGGGNWLCIVLSLHGLIDRTASPRAPATTTRDFTLRRPRFT